MTDSKDTELRQAYFTTVKILMLQIIDLNVNIMALRAALMQQSSLPVPAEELKRLTEFFHDYEPFRKNREAIESLGTDQNLNEQIEQLLKKFEGPIQ